MACSLNIIFGFSQTQLHIEGIVKEALSQSLMANVRVRLLERQVEMCGSTKILLPLFRRDFSIIKGEKMTDETGAFSFLITENLVEYYALEILFPDQQRQYISLISTHSPEKQVFSIEYLPISLSPETEDILERRHYAEKVKLEQEKINTALIEGNYPTAISQCLEENEPNQAFSCSISVPTQVYVSNLVSGYNSTATGPGFTGLMDFDEYIAGVTQQEIGGVTTLPEALKSLAVAARTFSYRRHTLNLPVNVGQAYSFSPNASCISASNTTTQQVMLYNNAVMSPNYAARCNGNFTQNSEQGRWGAGTCGTTCATCGNQVAYLRSVICSGHLNCLAFPSEQPCCELTISTVNMPGNIYGHGVGLCQRGTQQFAGSGFNWSYCNILSHYFKDICIANTQCAGGTTDFSVATIANPMTAGTVNGGGIFSTGTNVSLSFTTNSGYSFVNWTENGNVIGTSPTYSSPVNGNRNIVANFSATTALESEFFTDIKLFPNPSLNGEVFIQSEKMLTIHEVSDIMGKQIPFEIKKENKGILLQLTTQTQGMYFVKVAQNSHIKVLSFVIL